METKDCREARVALVLGNDPTYMSYRAVLACYRTQLKAVLCGDGASIGIGSELSVARLIEDIKQTEGSLVYYIQFRLGET